MNNGLDMPFSAPWPPQEFRATRSLVARRRHWAAWLCCGLFGLAGCQSVEDKWGIGKTFGRHGNLAQSYALRDPFAPLEGQDDFDKAQALYDKKEYHDAEKAFKKVAKKYKNKPIEEDSMFMVAEAKFMQNKYPQAQDAYGELMKKYTATRHSEKATRRLFTIARFWLKSPPLASEIELAQYTEGTLDTPEGNKEIPRPKQVLLAPNFFDKTHPMFDTHGRALQCLNSIWLNDPTGPIADDALMMAATHHMRKKDYKEADRFFNILREEYPNSEHVQTAYVVGQRVKLAAYQGAAYDGQALDDARKLTSSTIRLFPDLEQKERLIEDLRVMQDKAVEREWKRVELYLRKRQPASAAVYCRIILEHYPNSKYAEQAREVILKMGPEKAGTAWEALPRPSTQVKDTRPGRNVVPEELPDEDFPGAGRDEQPLQDAEPEPEPDAPRTTPRAAPRSTPVPRDDRPQPRRPVSPGDEEPVPSYTGGRGRARLASGEADE